MKLKKNRRDLLKESFYTSLGMFLSTKLLNFELIASVNAQELGASFLEHKLINFSLNGGGSRWYWDLPLAPNGSSDKLSFNPMCITRYGSNIQGPGEYRTIPLGDYHFPEIWSSNIPTTSGSAPMADLSDNMLAIRGLHLPSDGHVFGLTSQMQPLPGKSLLGVVADKSTLSLPAVVGVASHYYSAKGTPSVGLGTEALKAFNPPGYEARHLSVSDASVEGKIDEALLSLQESLKDKHRYIPKTFQQRLNAKKLLKKDFSNLNDAFQSLEEKYLDLMQSAFHDSQYTVAGVEDRAIAGDGSNSFRYGGGYYQGSDLRTCFDDQLVLAGNVASAFATAEFMVTEGYSSAFTSSSMGLDKFNAQGFTSGNGRRLFNYDVHDTGSHVALLKYTKIYKAYSALLYELIGKLKSKTSGDVSLFDKSLVTMTGDFNRSARMDGSGADHGASGTNYTIFSGKISKLTLVGNTKAEPTSNKYGGSWGTAAPLDFLGGRTVGIGNVGSTICTMIGADSLTPNDPSLVRMENGKIVAIADKPKNV